MTPRGTERKERNAGIGLGSFFSLREGVRLEPFRDGSAVLYSATEETSVSLNHTAALICAYADGRHTVEGTVAELRDLFPDTEIDPSLVLAHLRELVRAGYVEWV